MIQFAFRWLNVYFVNCFFLYSSFSPHLWMWNLVILNVINLTNSKLVLLRLPIFLTNFKEKEVHNQKSSKHFIVYTVFKMRITKLLGKPRWNRTKKVDRTVNATNRRGTGSSGRGPSQYRAQNESQSMPILITKPRTQKKQHEKIRS